jgi:DegV family protein with EDD domain
MEYQQLSPQHLLQAIISGCENLKQARKSLNEINFFPVADGDTGDNMAATASAIIEHAQIEPTVQDTLKSVANASIMGARGNSGMMFSSFFNGLFQAYQHNAHLNTDHFSQMLKKAAHQVRSSLIDPMEGTLLTVVEHWASLIENKSQDLTNFKTLCHDIMHPLKDALHKHCEYQHNSKKILDAGALGFYHFIEGFTQALGEDKPIIFQKPKSIEEFTPPVADHQFSAEPPKNRYCTEALLHDTHISPTQLQQHLAQFGDSIVVTGHQHLQRFHVHTNQPEKIFEWLQNVGRIANPKIDDMQRQFECHVCARRPIGLLTDSSSDLPTHIRDEHQIHLLPINIHMGEHHLLDPYSIQHQSFYESLKKTQQYPTTSAPNPLQIQNKFRDLHQKHDALIMISVAEKLSSTYASACNISQEFPNVHVVNSKLTSAGQSLLVYDAALKINQPHANVDEVLMRIKSSTNNIVVYVLVHKLDALMRSGRVDRLRGTFANLAGLRPIIKLNEEGRGEMYGKAISTKKGLQQLIQNVEIDQAQRNAKLAHYAIVHAGFEDGALQLSQLAKEKFQQNPLYISPVSAAIGLHAGYGCVGIAAYLEP